MAFSTISKEDTKDKGVTGLPAVPKLPTSDMQKKFDELSTDVIIPKFNALVEELGKETAAENIGVVVPEGVYAEPNLQAVLNGLETRNDKIRETYSEDSINLGRVPNSEVGVYSSAMGSQVMASGDYSHAEGSHTIATVWAAHAEGSNTKALGNHSHAEGSDTVATHPYTHAEGYKTVASYDAAHAEGILTAATSDAAHAEGYETQAVGFYAHAEGRGTLASAGETHAEGDGSKAIEIFAHAEGYYTIASGISAHAEGYYTESRKQAAHAEGFYTIANGLYQHVQGKFNRVDDDDKYAHIVGGGNSDVDRRNIYTLDWDGNAIYQGDVSIKGGSISLSNLFAEMKTLQAAVVDLSSRLAAL